MIISLLQQTTRLVVLAMVLLSTLAVFTAEAQGLTKVKYTLDWKINGISAPFIMAKAKGYYEQEGLDVQLDAGSGSAAAVTRVASGAYDLGIGDVTALIEFLANNPGENRLQAVYQVYQHTPFTIYTLKKNGITSVQQLNGKKVAAAATEANRRVWPIVAPKMKIGSPGVQWVTMDITLKETALLRGLVDATTAFESSIPTIYSRGVRPEDVVVFRFADYGVKLYGNAILATTKLINENPKAVAAFVRASNRAIKEAMANPADAVKYVKQREPIIDEALEIEQFKITMRYYVTRSETGSSILGSVDKVDLENQVDDVVRAFGLKSRPNPELIFNSKFLPPRSERTVN